MSIDRMLLARAQPPLAMARVEAAVRDERSKGCLPDLAPVPVALEPIYSRIQTPSEMLQADPAAPWSSAADVAHEDLCRLQVWPSPDEKFDWARCERFHKQVKGVTHRIGFEVAGNEARVRLNLLVHRADAPLLRAAFYGSFERSCLSPLDNALLSDMPLEAWNEARFWDYHPELCYCYLLTCPEELGISHLESVLVTMKLIPAGACGLYQVLYEPVRHNWHRNVERLLDVEYTVRQMQGLHVQQRYPQQAPSGNLQHMAARVETKAHNDRPFFCMALRVAVIGGGRQAAELLRQVEAFAGVFQHGGRPLAKVSEEAYRSRLSAAAIRDMFLCGRTYRPGFLVNSWELTGPVHVPPAKVLDFRQIPMPKLETLPARSTELLTGTPVGVCNHAGVVQTICLPPRIRRRHCHVLGKPDMGKSSLMENIILHDILSGDGVAVIDPHGDLVQRLIHLIPEEHVDRVIYFNMGDRDFIPIWNPVVGVPGQEPGRTSDDLVGAIKSLVTGWGDRLEHLMRHGLYAQLHMDGGTLRGLASLLRKGTPESEGMRLDIVRTIENELARDFWKTDFLKYGKDDLGPPQHKLSKLLMSSRTVSLMLSQPESLFNFSQIMNEGKVLLVNLATLGSEVRNILGCLTLVLLYLSALGRSEIPPSQRRPFHIHCDEAHRFVTGAIEDIIAEMRKFNVSLTLAHQYISQFGAESAAALSNVGSTIIFNVNALDAKYLTRDLQDLVKIRDIVSLKAYEAIAHIGTEIVRIRTLKPQDIPEHHHAGRIIAESRRRYYKPAGEVQGRVHLASNGPSSAAPWVATPPALAEELSYDTF